MIGRWLVIAGMVLVAGCGTAAAPVHQVVTLAPTSPPAPRVTLTCVTGWTPQPLGSQPEPFHPGPEPGWIAPPAGTYEYPAWQITVTSHQPGPVALGLVTVAYYTGSGIEIGSETVNLGSEVLTGYQATTVYGTSQIDPVAAFSCQVVAGTGP